MTSELSSASQREDQLDEIVLAYLKAVDSGQTPDPQEILARHPDLQIELAAFFEDQENVNRFSMPVWGLTKESSGATHPSSESVPNVPSTVAYQPESRERYSIVRLHAGGGIGDVYLAQDSDLGRQVALKELKPKFANLPMYQARFLEEARITGQLEHPGIVPVHELTRRAADQKPFYTMRFIKGRTLSHAIKAYHRKREAGETGPLDLRELLTVFVGVCNAVAYAHSRGVIHRDLKPQNVALGDFGEALVLDWGLAKVLGETNGEDSLPPVSVDPEAERGQTMQGSRIGTIPYMAPEQAEGRIDQMDRRTDVYGLGAILYEILTGEPPFNGPEESLVLDRVKHEPATPARQRVAATPVALEAVCVKALAKKREDRYGSAKELAQEIERFLADEPVAAYPEPLLVRARRWLGKHRTLATATAAAVIVAGLVGAVVLLVTANLGLVAEQQKTEVALGEKKEAYKEAETSLYFKRILLAEREWSANNIDGANQQLGECPEQLRGWEWRYLKNRLSPGAVKTLSGHGEVVVSVAVSSDGRLIATSSFDSSVKVWDAAKAELLYTLDGYTGYVFGVAFSPKNEFLASCSGRADTGSGEIIIWNLETRKPAFHPIKGHTGFGCRVAYSPDGKWLAATCGDLEKRSEVGLWNAATGESLGPPLLGDGQALLDVAFSPDGKYIAASSGTLDMLKSEKQAGQVIIWDAQTKKKVNTIGGHTASVTSLAFSPDSSRLASGSWDMTLKIYNVPTGTERYTIWDHSHFVTSVAFNGDGTKIASATEDGMVKVWDAESGEAVRTYRGHTKSVQGVKFIASQGAPEVERLVSVSEDLTGRIWDLRTEQEATSLTGDGTWVTCVAYSPNGDFLAAGGVNKIVTIYDTKTHKEVQRLERHLGAVRGLAFSPDNQSLAVSCGDWGERDEQGEVKVWNLETKTSKALPVQIGPAWSVAFSPDGRRIAAGTGNWSKNERPGKIYIWDAKTYREIHTLEGHVGLVWSVAFSRDGKRLASAGGEAYTPGQVKVWNTDTWQEESFSNPSNNPRAVVSVAYSRDGQYLASGRKDKKVLIQDAASGEVIHTLEGHTHEVSSVAFSPDGKRLVSSSLDMTVKLWDTDTGQEIITLRTRRRPNLISCVTFSPNNERIVSAGLDGNVRIWDAGAVKRE